MIETATTKQIPELLEVRFNSIICNKHGFYTDRELKVWIQDLNLDEFENIIHNDSLFIFKDSKNNLCAMAGWYKESVRHTHVLPSYFGQGIGSELMAYVENDFSKRTGKTKILCGCAGNSLGFYQKLGYKILKEAYDWDGSFYYELTKELS